MRTEPVTRVVCLVFAALLVLPTAAPTAAPADTIVDIEPKTRGVEAKGPDKKQEPKKIPVGRKTEPTLAKGRATIILKVLDKPNGAPAKAELSYASNLLTGRLYELKGNGPGVWINRGVPAGIYSVTYLGTCGSCNDPGRKVGADAYVTIRNGQTKSVRFHVDRLPDSYSEQAKEKLGKLRDAKRRCKTYDFAKSSRAFKIMREAAQRRLDSLQSVWPEYRKKFLKGLPSDLREKVGVVLALKDPRAQQMGMKKIEASYFRGPFAKRISHLKLVYYVKANDVSTVQSSKKGIALLKTLPTRDAFIGKQFLDRAVLARKNRIGRARRTGIQVRKGDCLTIFVRKDSTWSARTRAWTVWKGSMIFVGTSGLVARYDGKSRLLGNLDGRTFSGHWVAPRSAKRCGTAKFGSRYWGRIEFTMNKQHDRFTGKRGYCAASPSLRVWGRRQKSSRKASISAGGSDRFPPVTDSGATFRFGSLVGRVGKKGRYFFVGTRHRRIAKRTGELRLYIWRKRSRDVLAAGLLRARIHVRRKN